MRGMSNGMTISRQIINYRNYHKLRFGYESSDQLWLQICETSYFVNITPVSISNGVNIGVMLDLILFIDDLEASKVSIGEGYISIVLDLNKDLHDRG
jgi:hypothetical protein